MNIMCLSSSLVDFTCLDLGISYIQLFRQRLCHNSTKPHTAMSIGVWVVIVWRYLIEILGVSLSRRIENA